jgi:hypothetical protein
VLPTRFRCCYHAATLLLSRSKARSLRASAAAGEIDAMTLQELGNLGELVGGIAVIVSLVYLAAQIRRNTRTVRASSSLAFARISQDFSAMLITDEKVARLYRLGLKDSSQFGEDQAVQFDALMITMFRDSQNIFQQYRQSQLDEEEWETFARNVLWNFHQPGVQQWWHSRRLMFIEPFRTFLEGERGGTGRPSP